MTYGRYRTPTLNFMVKLESTPGSDWGSHVAESHSIQEARSNVEKFTTIKRDLKRVLRSKVRTAINSAWDLLMGDGCWGSGLCVNSPLVKIKSRGSFTQYIFNNEIVRQDLETFELADKPESGTWPSWAKFSTAVACFLEGDTRGLLTQINEARSLENYWKEAFLAARRRADEEIQDRQRELMDEARGRRARTSNPFEQWMAQERASLAQELFSRPQWGLTESQAQSANWSNPSRTTAQEIADQINRLDPSRRAHVDENGRVVTTRIEPTRHGPFRRGCRDDTDAGDDSHIMIFSERPWQFLRP